MEYHLTDLCLRHPTQESRPFIPTLYQQGIECCFEQPSARLWFPKTERQTGLTTILAACVAKHFQKNKTLVVCHNRDNKLRFMGLADYFYSQWCAKNNVLFTHTTSFGAPGVGVVYAVNDINLWQATNSVRFDLVVFDEAHYGTYKYLSQLDFLYPSLTEKASILMFGG